MLNLPVLNCDGCNASCCRHMVMPPFVPLLVDLEWVNFLQNHPDLAAEIEAEYRRKRAEADWPSESPCFWLDTATGRCKHYNERPEICRDFEVGGEYCLEARDYYGVGKCDGD
jgi:uncharacterized protein